jgi:hypothetical protein
VILLALILGPVGLACALVLLAWAICRTAKDAEEIAAARRASRRDPLEDLYRAPSFRGRRALR